MSERVTVLKKQYTNHAGVTAMMVELWKRVAKLEAKLRDYARVNQYQVTEQASLAGRCKVHEERQAVRREQMRGRAPRGDGVPG